MKKIVLTIAFVASVLGLQAQSRKHVANFSLFQQYYNPALTGYEGSAVKTFYRNQWTGFEDAPKTIFASGELDLADLKAWKQDGLLKSSQQDNYDRQSGSHHAIGLSLLNDRFGPFAETQLQLSYAARVQLSESLNLRWGSAFTYNAYNLDGNRLTIDQENDPEFAGMVGQSNRSGKADLNLGLTLTSENFYVGYALHGATKGKLITTGDEYMEDSYSRHHVVQAGYRHALSDQVGLVANAMYRYDDLQKETIEGQLKGVYQNFIWIGGGLRKDLAFSATAGVRLDQLKIGYVYESPTGDARSISMATNEVSLTYNLIRVKHPKYSRQITIW